ncbi:MAG: DUF2917 domain-containing protein [Curvibacter sp.]
MNLALPSPLSLPRALSRTLSCLLAGPRSRAREASAARPADLRALPQDAVWVLPHPQGQRIECLSGALWITQDWQPADIFLSAGQSCTVHLPYPLRVQALQPARVQAHAA